ncbi:serine/threonine protein kinase [Gemmatimonadota bacterium]
MKEQLVGHYKVLEKLGSGGMGEVWLAEDSRLDRKVALKFLPHFAAQDETEKARFKQEAKAAARLSHANIAQIYEIDEEDGRLYIVMEYVPGGSLRDVLDEAKRKSLPLEQVVTWIQQISDGLAEAHRQGIIHRDIKPDNLMLTETGQVKITDFGLARLETTTRLTASGTTLGTVNYMSPELITGRTVDHRSDLFSLGVTFYELLTGRQVFSGQDASAIYYEILSGHIDPVTRFRSDMNDQTIKIIEKLLEREPDLRYQSASDLTTDLKRLSPSDNKQLLVGSLPNLFVKRIASIPKKIWITWGLLALSMIIASIRPVRIFHDYSMRTIQDYGESEFGWSGISAIPEILEELEAQKQKEDIDDYLTSILLAYRMTQRGWVTHSEKRPYAQIALDIIDESLSKFPSNLRLQDIKAKILFDLVRSLRGSGVGQIAEVEAYRASRNAIRLDPDNGARALVAASRAYASGDTSAGDGYILDAIQSPVFRSGWSEYLSSVYRSLENISQLSPDWFYLPYELTLGDWYGVIEAYLHTRLPQDWRMHVETLVDDVFDRDYLGFLRINQHLSELSNAQLDNIRVRGRNLEELGHLIIQDDTRSRRDQVVATHFILNGLATQILASLEDPDNNRYLQSRFHSFAKTYMAYLGGFAATNVMVSSPWIIPVSTLWEFALFCLFLIFCIAISLNLVVKDAGTPFIHSNLRHRIALLVNLMLGGLLLIRWIELLSIPWNPYRNAIYVFGLIFVALAYAGIYTSMYSKITILSIIKGMIILIVIVPLLFIAEFTANNSVLLVGYVFILMSIYYTTLFPLVNKNTQTMPLAGLYLPLSIVIVLCAVIVLLISIDAHLSYGNLLLDPTPGLLF